MMKAWHFLKHLNCTPAAASLSLHLLRSSSFSLNRYFPSHCFLSVHTTASDHWPARGQVTNGHAKFSTASSSLAVHSMASPVPVPANYVSVLVRCHKDNSDMLAEAILSFGASSVTMNEDDVCPDTDEVCVSSIFLEGEDINMSISHAADSIGLKEIPRYEVKIIEEDDWMKGAQFGAAFAVGVDIDSQAIASASENATLNNIGPDKLQLQLIASQTSSSCRDDWPSRVVEGENAFEIDRVTHKDKYDVVIANILLNPLLNLADQIIFSAKPGAIIGLSGILSEQVQNILQKYSLFLEDIEVSKMDDWACVSGRKRKNIDIC
ncbi:uncharacterized protein LOC107630228 isoform X3 [Arachis ipaensis]|uniref:uncharacterized protein LOC107630228 isoform X3 n=1 Tax=Arachis ipaensis TaxID=130454 RepID=UPI0007AF2D7A|nr:uncharacterized protein LOC107630228 isoform X3 [Arachis ipaensis]XP_025643969.1 uncharacterized protein LOC112737984 isoform X2 [Arachis hypogaea]